MPNIKAENNVLCLVVTYNGSKTIESTINSLFRQTRLPDKILVIDNASTDTTINIVSSLNIKNLEFTALSSNIGVAEAFNMGIDAGIKEGYRWLWIFDQDTVCNRNCLSHLLRPIIEGKVEMEKLAALCPTTKSKSFPEIDLPAYRWNGKRFVNVFNQNSEKLIPIHSTITSGTLYQLNALKKTGGFRNDYFIDFVDHEYHMRLHKAGYKMFWVDKANIFHELGTAIKGSNGEVIFVHEPWRYYYMGRNMTHGFYKLGGFPSVWAFWSDAMKQLKMHNKVNGNTNISFLFFTRGVIDSFINNLGKLNKSFLVNKK